MADCHPCGPGRPTRSRDSLSRYPTHGDCPWVRFGRGLSGRSGNSISGPYCFNSEFNIRAKASRAWRQLRRANTNCLDRARVLPSFSQLWFGSAVSLEGVTVFWGPHAAEAIVYWLWMDSDDGAPCLRIGRQQGRTKPKLFFQKKGASLAERHCRARAAIRHRRRGCFGRGRACIRPAPPFAEGMALMALPRRGTTVWRLGH